MNKISIHDDITMLELEINAASVFMVSFNDKLDFMVNLFLEAEQKLQNAEKRCKELKAELEKEL